MAIKVLSLFWGFSFGGGGAQYARLLEETGRFGPIDVEHVSVLSCRWRIDWDGLQRLGARQIKLRSRSDLSWLWRVPRLINELRPDLVMTHGFNTHFVVMMTRARYRCAPRLVASYHGAYYAPTRWRRVLEPVFNAVSEHYLKRYADAIVSVSGYSKDHLVKRGVPMEKISVVRNGIEPEAPTVRSRSEIRQTWGVSQEAVVIGAASRLDPVKGVDYLVEAFSRICVSRPGVRLVIVGSGPSEQELKAAVAEAGIDDKVVFTGARSDVADSLAAFDVFVLPSLMENHSIGLLEAMRAGRAIVATRVGGNTESVSHDHEALIVEPADPAALSGAMERVVDDAALRARLGAAAQRRFRSEFTNERMARETAEWLLEAAGGGDGIPGESRADGT